MPPPAGRSRSRVSKFGKFTGLEQTASSPLDSYANTHTLTYSKATYTSQFLVFNATEQLSNHCVPSSVIPDPNGSTPPYVCNNDDYYPVKTPDKQVSSLVDKYDTSKYFGQLDSQGAGIPFIDFGGKYAESGALYDPTLLQGANWDSIVAAFAVPNQGIGQAILATANRYTAILCEMTNGKPGSVCNASYVKTAEKALKP